MKRGEMNEVQCEEADVGRYNHKWLCLGTTLSATHLVGWMRLLKQGNGWIDLTNAINAYEHRSYLRNSKDRLSFWSG